MDNAPDFPGRQRIHRAELHAIWWICQNFTRAIVHTDSAVVISQVERIRGATTLEDCVLHPDYDILAQLWQVLAPTHTIHKVKSHQRTQDVSDDLERYHAWGNTVADAAAVKATRTLFLEAAT